MNKEKFYITTAIAYTSTKPHIGNTYEIVLADAIARYKRLTGYDVYLQTGTDEHGFKIQEKAEAAGIKPQEYVDGVAGEIKDIWDLMNTSYDAFVRTSDEEHKKKVQKIFKKLYDQGDIYKGEYSGWYCVPCESFWTDTQVIAGKCPDCGRAVTKQSEEAYFFKLSKYQDRLLKHIEDNPSFIEPVSRKNEMLNNFIRPGLEDLCVSRTSFDWGVQVDFDPKHVVYVWLDALSNYITFIGYDPDGNHTEQFKKLWPADIHLIGKDIIRFHTIYWPIFLMALGLELPKEIYGHPWLLASDGKMSKSTGNVLYADDLVAKFGLDQIRYYLLSELSFANDGGINEELIVERINSDLANTLGNLVNRTISMAHKYFDGIIINENVEEEIDVELKNKCQETILKYDELVSEYKLSLALDTLFEFLRTCNKYIDETAPWSLAKDESTKGRLATVLYNLLEAIRISAVLLQPIIPDTAEKIFKQLNTAKKDYASIKTFGNLEVGKKLNLPEVLFARIETK